MKQDFYQTLGISRQASQDDIKKAYRQAAMKYHPDRNAGNPTMEKKFKEVNEAYQTLSDPQSRKRYDQFGSADMGAGFGGGRGGASAGGGFGGFEDLFSQFGSGGFEDLFSQSSRSSAVNLDTVVEQKIPFLDFLLGGKFEYRQVNGKILTITVPPKTEPGTKFRVAGKGRVSGSRVGDLFFELHPEFPRGTLSGEMHEKLEKIRQELAALR